MAIPTQELESIVRQVLEQLDTSDVLLCGKWGRS